MTPDVFTDLLHLSTPAFAIAFTDAPPPGVSHVASSGPASCDYWRQAAEGKTFYTRADEQQQLMGLIHTMVGLSYLRMEDVYAIPGAHLGTIVDSLRTIVKANDALEAFHRQRAAAAF